MNINATIIGQSISFFLFIYLVSKYVWPPLITAMDERTTKILKDLRDAKRARESVEQKAAQAKNIISKAHEDAKGIISQAKKAANEESKHITEQAREDSMLIIDNARRDLDTEIEAAKLVLRMDISKLVLQGVESIVGREVKENDHKDIIRELERKV